MRQNAGVVYDVACVEHFPIYISCLGLAPSVNTTSPTRHLPWMTFLYEHYMYLPISPIVLFRMVACMNHLML